MELKRLITRFRGARHWTSSWDGCPGCSLIFYFLKKKIILFFHVCQGLLQVLQIKCCMHLLFHTTILNKYLAHSSEVCFQRQHTFWNNLTKTSIVGSSPPAPTFSSRRLINSLQNAYVTWKWEHFSSGAIANIYTAHFSTKTSALSAFKRRHHKERDCNRTHSSAYLQLRQNSQQR